MKSSVHLFYGIIIGILICACSGSLKDDKAEFEEEIIGFVGTTNDIADYKKTSDDINQFKKDGWTIIDWEVDGDGRHYFHLGK